MITLKSPITISIPSIKKADGTTKDFSPVVLSEIDCVVTYDNARKIASAMIKGVNRMVTLWQGDAYDKAGEFTDSDVDARLAEILGNDPASFISSLFQPVRHPAPPVATK